MKHKSPNHPCEVCDFKATSDSDLKRHAFTSHKDKTKTKEIERLETMENSIVLSLEKKERSDDCQNLSPYSQTNLYFRLFAKFSCLNQYSIGKVGIHQVIQPSVSIFPLNYS